MVYFKNRSILERLRLYQFIGSVIADEFNEALHSHSYYTESHNLKGKRTIAFIFLKLTKYYCQMKRKSGILEYYWLLLEDEEELTMLQMLPILKRKKTHKMIKNREEEGTYTILIKKYLFSEDDKFLQYFRVTPNIFYKILDKISVDIVSTPCNRVKKPISSEQKLCVALR